MTQMTHRFATCDCGRVELEISGRPIVTAVCYCQDCQDCQAAARVLASRTGAPAILEEDGGTELVLVRKDRVRCLKGAGVLKEYRLTSTTATRRVVATCCNRPMFLDFTKGHWLSVYRGGLIEDARPPIDMRIMIKDRQSDLPFADSAPRFSKNSARFVWKLMSDWAVTGFKTPRINYVEGEIDPAGA